MSSQLSAQAITAQTAITRMSIRRCSILPWQRGSSTPPRGRTRLSMDMILSSPARGHVIIHQARARDRNSMRLPCSHPPTNRALAHPYGPGDLIVAKPELGLKRQCMTCGARFYDLNRTPITVWDVVRDG